MLLSIIVTTYNRQDYLAELLACLRLQWTDPGWPVELLVADNASTDATPEVIASASANGLALRHIRRPVNVGFSRNLQLAADEARGRYLWPLCDDDLLEPGALPAVVAALSESQAGLHLLNRNIYDVTMQRLLRGNCLGTAGSPALAGSAMIVRFGSELLTASCVIVRTDLARLGFARPEYIGYYCETLVLACEALRHGPGLVLGDIFVRYREGNSGAWNIWWPMISVFYMPLVIGRSSLGKQQPNLVHFFVKSRGGSLLEGFTRLSSSKNQKIRSQIPARSEIRSIYGNYPNFELIYSFAFELPVWISRLYGGSCMTFRFTKKQLRTKSGINFKIIFELYDKYRSYRNKELR